MIAEHTKLGAVEVVPPDLQGKHNSRQLLVMSGVVSLMYLELPRKVGHLMKDWPQPRMKAHA